MPKVMRELLINQGNLEPTIYLAPKNSKKVSYKEFLDIIACPRCHRDLKLSKNHFTCERCKSKFEIKNGIPNMLLEDATRIK